MIRSGTSVQNGLINSKLKTNGFVLIVTPGILNVNILNPPNFKNTKKLISNVTLVSNVLSSHGHRSVGAPRNNVGPNWSSAPILTIFCLFFRCKDDMNISMINGYMHLINFVN